MLSDELLDEFNKPSTRDRRDWLWTLRDKVLVLEEGQEPRAEESACARLLDILGVSSVTKPDFSHVQAVVDDWREELDEARKDRE